jgi:phosphoribosylformimino-5-aminoimidazole carboxamide ribotide isomerase
MDGLDLARRLVDQGCRRIITTDIATDGAFTGPNIPWLRAMAEAVPVPVIASGGVASLEDIGRLQTEVAGIEGVIVGKALYEGRIDLRAAVSTLAQATVP